MTSPKISHFRGFAVLGIELVFPESLVNISNLTTFQRARAYYGLFFCYKVPQGVRCEQCHNFCQKEPKLSVQFAMQISQTGMPYN